MNAVSITVQIIAEEYPISLLPRSPPGGKLQALVLEAFSYGGNLPARVLGTFSYGRNLAALVLGPFSRKY